MSSRSGGARRATTATTTAHAVTVSYRLTARPFPGDTETPQEKAQAAFAYIFGHPISEHDLARLAGAQPGDHLDVQAGLAPRTGVVVSLDSPHMEHRFLLYRGTYEQPDAVVFHDYYTGNKGARTATSGREILQGIQEAHRLGVTRIEATAARYNDRNEDVMNGYYTWARLGFTGDIPEDVLPAAQARFGSGVTRVDQLMQEQGGPQWWKQHGSNWQATFDFADPYSRAVLRRYLRALKS